MAQYARREETEQKVDLSPEEDIEIEITDEDGETLYSVGPDGEIVPVEESGVMGIGPGDDGDWNANLAEFIDEQELTKLATNLIELYEADKRSRADWWNTYVNGLDLIGLKIEERSMPWRDACGVFHPLLAEALIRYVSEAALELFPPSGPAQVKIIGPETTETRKQAARVKAELNYQLTKKMPGNRDDLEMTIWRQALAGACFRKGYKDPVTKRPVLKMVPADNLIAQYGTVSLHTCGRYTHEMTGTSKNDVMKLMAVGFYRAIDLGDTFIGISDDTKEKEDELQGQSKSYETNDEDMTILEMYVDVDLPGYEHTNDRGIETGIKLPYIITIDKDSQKILSIYRNHDEDKPFEKRRVYFSHYKYMAGFGLYGFGLIHILGGLTDGATSILRQLVDAGVLNNLPAGFKSRSLRIKGDDTPLRPGELRDVDLPPGMLEKSISWIPTKEPSVVLAGLLDKLVDEGRRVGSVSDMKIGEAGGANAPVGTTLAMLEVHRKVISAVGARNYASMETELEMVSDILANDMPPEYDYPIEGGPFNRQADFGPPLLIYPVADPSGSTASLRIMRYSAVEQLSERAPHLYDMAYLHRQIVETYDIPNADKIIPLADEFVPIDPVAENMNMLQMRPVKAFMNQDHEAHITTHMAAMQDPIIQQLVGQSPNAAAIQAASMAHIQEHVAYAYRDKMQQALGLTLPEPGATLPPEQENALSRAIAEAAQQVLGRSQAQAAAQAAQQAAQDPMLQLRMKEVGIKEKEAEVKLLAAKIKAATDTEKTALLARKEELEALIALEELAIEKERLKIDAKKVDADIQDKQENRDSSERMESIRIAADTINKAQDRDERRESSTKTHELKKRDIETKARTRGKPSNKS